MAWRGLLAGALMLCCLASHVCSSTVPAAPISCPTKLGTYAQSIIKRKGKTEVEVLENPRLKAFFAEKFPPGSPMQKEQVELKKRMEMSLEDFEKELASKRSQTYEHEELVRFPHLAPPEQRYELYKEQLRKDNDIFKLTEAQIEEFARRHVQNPVPETEGEEGEDEEPTMFMQAKALRQKQLKRGEARPQLIARMMEEVNKANRRSEMRPDRLLRKWGWQIRCAYAEIQDNFLDQLGLLVEKLMPLTIVLLHFPPFNYFTREASDTGKGPPGARDDDDDDDEYLRKESSSPQPGQGQMPSLS